MDQQKRSMGVAAAFILIASTATPSFSQELSDNLLQLSGAGAVADAMFSAHAEQLPALTDGDAGTVAAFDVENSSPIDVVYHFGGEMVAPQSVSVTLSGDPEHVPPARMDILVSTISATSGFSSLQSERIDSLRPRQVIKFRSAGANWIMLRLFPAEGSDVVAVADLSVAGRIGAPETSYAFGETPARALQIIKELESLGTGAFTLSSEERAIFGLAADGNLATEDFETVALFASGVTDPAARARYRATLDRIEAEARAAVDTDARPQDRGAALLEWLHDHVFFGGYQENQTDLSIVLDDGVFNCVSSAVVYHAIGMRLGLDVRAIEVPDHAFSIVYDDVDHMDVETTTRHGFNPRRDRITEFEALTGFRYIPQSNKSKRREIDAAGLAALIYYNHGVEFLRAGQYLEALAANFRAMSLDPEFASAATNALAALASWSQSLADAGEWENATRVAAVGITLAPADARLTSNTKAVWQRWAFAEADSGRPEVALDILERAAAASPTLGFEQMRPTVFTRPAERLIATGDWIGALAATDAGLTMLNPTARNGLMSWRRDLYLRWANNEMKQGNWKGALEVLQRGRKTFSQDRKIISSVSYLAQEWTGETDFGAGIVNLLLVKQAFPDIADLDKVAETFVRRTIRSRSQVDPIEDTLVLVSAAAPLLAPETQAELGAFVYESYGHPLIDARDWESAARVYAEGRKRFSNSRILTANARFLAQEWQSDAMASGGTEALGEIIVRLLSHFPDFGVDQGFGENEIIRQVNASVREREYDAALAALNEAQLILREKTYHDLRLYIIDRRAQDAMNAANWAKAAQIYADARTELADDTPFSNNIVYIAQEWTRAVGAKDGASGVAAAMKQLFMLFPGDKDVAGMGLRTLNRIVSSAVKAENFEAAEDHVRSSRVFLPQDDVASLTVTLYATWAATRIDGRDWRGAATIYAKGLSIVPSSRDLERNVPYVFHEWAREALSDGGATSLVAAVGEMREAFPDSNKLDDVLESVLARSIERHIADGSPDAALGLIGEVSDAIPGDVSGRLKEFAYDSWARSFMDRGEWSEVIRVYDLNLADIPGNWRLENNRKYAVSKLN